MIKKTFKSFLLSGLSILACATPADASEFMGLYSGLEESALHGILTNQGDGFYKGVINNSFVSIICFEGKVGVLDIIYDYSGTNTAPPRELRQYLTLAQAIKVHSKNSTCALPDFRLGFRRDGTSLGIVDTVNRIAYTINGPVAAGTQCAQVSYLSPQAPLLESTQLRALSPAQKNLLTEASSEIKNFETDGKPAKEENLTSESKSEKPRVIPSKMPTRMADCFEVKLIYQQLEKFGVTDRLVFLLSLHNKTPKDIRAIKGSARLLDIFGDPIYTFVLKIDDPIAAGECKADEYGFEFNKYIAAHRTLLTTKAKDITVDWKPELILFTDGSSVRKATAQSSSAK